MITARGPQQTSRVLTANLIITFKLLKSCVHCSTIARMLLIGPSIGLCTRLMIIASIIRIISAVKCQHCNGDFHVLGRHTWRCKGRVTSSESVSPVMPSPKHKETPPNDNLHGVAVNSLPSVSEEESCVCGRKCKGRRDLKTHQRSCAFYKSVVDGDILHPPSPSIDPSTCLSSAPCASPNSAMTSLNVLPSLPHGTINLIPWRPSVRCTP